MTKARARRHLKTVREIFEAEGYTYVALGLGRLRRGKWESTNQNPHVTIAYGAAMDDSQQKALRETLAAQILEWCRLQPHKRLANLIRFRRFETQTRQEKAGSTRLTRDSTRKPIALMQPTDVSDMLAEGRIHTLDVDELDDLREFVWRLYDRDRDRLSEGRKRAEHLRANEGTLEIVRTFEGLGGESLELADLLWYLSDSVRSFAGASKRMDPKPGQRQGKLVPPYVVPPHRWHVTKQGAWLRTHESYEWESRCRWSEAGVRCPGRQWFGRWPSWVGAVRFHADLE